ncbi:DapH/DapD/GlmU-related protein [Aestuariispira insulae]|uniref:Phosphonate metabolism protein (Transferase hexapeptide repeat family) n=1 Tax=Aestuariispira insulae TaxID=1461337 RepID=A0A3D9H5S9_9PROT|nr:DapH/DapD/GlmU-related protein [Aestuariispira insulae]RED44867.1 hypothetical protein DFP90_11372 [Aestuariispira insulae]
MKRLSPQPTIDPTALVQESELGAWTEVGARTKVSSSRMGDYSYIVNDGDMIYADIGKFANIAAHVRINPGQHPMDRASQHHFQYRSAAYDLGEDDIEFFEWRRSKPVKMGHDVWIGHGAVIMGPVTIGTGAVIGAGSIVTRDVPDYTIVAGVPAKPLRQRFELNLQRALFRIAWWNWSHETYRERLQDFRKLDCWEFCLKYDPGV